MAYELKELQDSTPGNKQIISAEDLMYNFRQLEKSVGSESISTLIESTGIHYNPLVNTQLARAIVQYVLGAYLFDSVTTIANNYVIAPKTGYYSPNTYTDGMKVTFYNNMTNTGPSVLRIDGMEDTQSYPIKYNGTDLLAGDIAANTNITVVYKITSEGSYFELERSANEGSSIKKLETMIANTITSASLTYNLSNESQLTQAIAAYTFGHTLVPDTIRTNGSTYYLNTYPLKNGDPLKQIPVALSLGQVYYFVPNMDNLTQEVTLILNYNTGMSGRLVNNDGSLLDIGQLKAGVLTAVIVEQIFDDNNNVVSSYFKLATGTLPFLKLGTNKITDISTDVSFENASDNSIATTKAIKEYVNTVAHSNEANSIASGAVDAQNHAKFVSQLGDSSLQIITSTDKLKDIEFVQAYAGTSPVIPASVTAYSTLNDLDNDCVEPVIVISKTNQGYIWSSNTPSGVTGITNGYAIDGLPRKVIETAPGDPSSRIVQIDTNSPVGNQEYLNFAHITGRVDVVKIKHKEGNPVPEKLKLYISLDNSNWYPLCNIIDGLPNYDYTILETADAEGYITIQVPTHYYVSAVDIREYQSTQSALLQDYSFMIKVDLFTAAQYIPQEVLEDIVNINTYNPVTDNNDEILRYAWQVEDVNLLAYDKDIKPLLVTFADGTALSLYKNVDYTILDVFNNQNNTGSVVSYKKPGEYFIVLNSAGDMTLVNKENYVISDTDPCEHADGYYAKPDIHWVNNSVYPNIMSVGQPVEVEILENTSTTPATKYFTYNGVNYTLNSTESGIYDVGDICNITPTTEGGQTVPHLVLPRTTRPTGNDDFDDDILLYMLPMNDAQSVMQFITIGEATLTGIYNNTTYVGTKISYANAYNIGEEHEFIVPYNPSSLNREVSEIYHNFGTNVSTKVIFECISDDQDITAGTCYELSPYTHHRVAMRQVDAFVTSVDFTNNTTTAENAITDIGPALATSNFLIFSNKALIKLVYENLTIYNEDCQEVSPTPGKWRFIVEVTKRHI